MSRSVERAGVVPATLSFLSIYNPSLSSSDETFEDQIVYYYSKPANGRRTSLRGKSEHGVKVEETKEEKDEKLRQIGLAQGMIGFARNFSDGEAVDSIETEKSRIILHELEKDWWILASIDLTRLSTSSELSEKGGSPESEVQIEYSAREVCPPVLLLQQVLRAHRIFLLHQAPSITHLFNRVARPKFCEFLRRFWDDFTRNWDVLLHGNPGVDIFNGLKLAAGGELGIGVGEEEWGSGEREVLEGFIGRTEGLVDLVVSRFGDSPGPRQEASKASSPSRILGDSLLDRHDCGGYPRPSDGVVFSGIGALARSSVRDISSWMEWLHMYEQDAYGVRENPTSASRRRRKRLHKTLAKETVAEAALDMHQNSNNNLTLQKGKPDSLASDSSNVLPGIPRSIIAAQTSSPAHTARSESKTRESSIEAKADGAHGDTPEQSLTGTETLVKYLTLGVYGSTWGMLAGRTATHPRVSSLRGNANDQTSKSADGSFAKSASEDAPAGYFLIGLKGEVEENVPADHADSDTETCIDDESLSQDQDANERIMMRTLHVERTRRDFQVLSNVSTDSANPGSKEAFFDRVRVIVYVQPPFIFTFLFELQTDALAIPAFYRSLHHQLGPLQRPLLASTSPTKVSGRLWEATAPKSTAAMANTQPISDLVFDPLRLTVHTTIPNIPEPGQNASDAATILPWTRIEALRVHSQILNTYASTRRHTTELERTSKTSRGWWVVWLRLPQVYRDQTSHTDKTSIREAFLIRKASDYVSPALRKSSGRFGTEVTAPGGWGPGKLAEGIGIDARQYIEGLLSLNR